MIRQTDHTMPACDPSSCAGAVPARDRLRIVLQYSGERTYNALALRLGLKRSENLYRIRKGYNGISMDLALRIRNICPLLSLSWLLGGEGDPEIPDQTSAEAASAACEPAFLPQSAVLGPELDFKKARAVFEARYLEAKLHECGGNITRLAETIGLERSYLHRKLKGYGISSE